MVHQKRILLYTECQKKLYIAIYFFVCPFSLREKWIFDMYMFCCFLFYFFIFFVFFCGFLFVVDFVDFIIIIIGFCFDNAYSFELFSQIVSNTTEQYKSIMFTIVYNFFRARYITRHFKQSGVWSNC